MLLNNTDKHWDIYGQKDPYYGVLSQDRFRRQHIDAKTLSAFFETGETHIAECLRIIETRLGSELKFRRALDFGCGVGRTLIPISKLFSEAVGVDVSPSMLDEARLNCQKYEVTNVTLLPSDDNLSAVSDQFDFIHTFIVLQHIPKRRGEAIVRKLIDLLADGGVAAIHLTYYNASSIRKIIDLLRTSVPFVNPLLRLLQGRSTSEPPMQMNEYNLNGIMQIIQSSGVNNVHMQFTKEGPFCGVVIYLCKQHLSGA